MNFQEARDIRDRVLNDLPGPWKGFVWENLGWHVGWNCGAVSLHFSGANNEKPFWAMVGPLGSNAGDYAFQMSKLHLHFATPQEAIRYICEDAEDAIKHKLLPIISSVRSVREMVRE